MKFACDVNIEPYQNFKFYPFAKFLNIIISVVNDELFFYHFLVILISYLISSHCQKYLQSTIGSTYNIERESNYRNV